MRISDWSSDVCSSDLWRRQRRAGMISIAGSALVAALLWFGLRWIAPTIPGMEALADRLIYAFKWWCLALFFCFAMGVEAVAHERLQSPAFDPLTGYETRSEEHTSESSHYCASRIPSSA